MAGITATFKLVDEMSSYLENIANSGLAIVANFDDIESSVNAAFDNMESGAAELSAAFDNLEVNVDTAGLEDLNSAIDGSIGSADELDTAISDFEAEVDCDELEDLNSELEAAAENAGEAETSVSDALKGIATVLTTLGVATMIKDIAEGLYDMTNATSEARGTIVKATGATGETLEGLMDSYWNVYGSALTGDADSISATIGEVNTRLGYTGELLEETTTQFLEFSQATGVDAVSAVQDVTQVMNLWGIEADDLGTTLDKLDYYSQVSGGSVDDLMTTLENGAAVFQNAGLTFDQTVQLLADLELYGINSTTALTGFRTAINKISEEGGDAETELANIIQKIAECDTQSEATAIAVDYFGSRAGQQLALAIREGAISVESFTGDLSAAEGTLSTTAETAQTLSEKWDQAGRSIEAAFGAELTPIIEGVSGAFADLAIDIGEFLQETPEAVAIITGIGTALGTVVVAFSGVAMYQNVILPMIESLGGVFSTAALPITAAAVAIGAVTTAIMLLYDTSHDLNPDGTSFDEFMADVDQAIQKSQSYIEEYNNTMKALDASELGDLALVDRIAELAAQEELSNTEMLEMQSLIQRLNSDIPGLGLTYDSLTGNIEDYTEALRAQIEAEYDRQRQSEQLKEIENTLMSQAELNARKTELEGYIAAQKEEYGYHESWTGAGMITVNGIDVGVGSAADPSNLSAYLAELDTVNAEMAAGEEHLAELQEAIKETEITITEGADEVTQATEAVTIVTGQYYDQIVELAEAYQTAYEAAKESFDGQFDLFDQAEANAEATVSAAQAALDSQLAYWTNYAANMEILKDWQPSEDMGVTQEDVDALMAYVQTGSEDAAGLAQSMVDAITSGDESAVADLASTLAEVESAKESAASTVAEWQTGFDEQMQAIVDSMDESMAQVLEGIEISDQTYAAAQNAIQQYANGILAMKGQVIDAASQIAQAAQNAINNISLNANVSVATVGHASGTTNAEDVFLAGEEGPELIVGKGGSTVFPASETNRIISAVNSRDYGYGDRKESSGPTSGYSEKKLVIEIAGGGRFTIGAGTSEDDVIELLEDNIRPILLEKLREEILTEGDGVYVY